MTSMSPERIHVLNEQATGIVAEHSERAHT